MPKKYWRNLPEAAAIPRLVQSAPQRVTRMIEQEATMPAKRIPTGPLRRCGIRNLRRSSS
jgi:DNA polymerase